ncbi:exportin-like protein [Stylonychia lemnae]|uniref:Exportin-like protein n=1 Tax=Stylonychia lemnae TaxID=5949 RepID=A0A077ZMU7_STYLE|nr:exportin-like protein [Stylonychia lemnae]|eukprot:CDW71253.1 exportin-like protein [Stylonychia lemnae]
MNVNLLNLQVNELNINLSKQQDQAKVDPKILQELEFFEKLCNNLYSHQTSTQFLEISTINYVQFLSASALKNLLTEHWSQISFDDKFNTKFYILNYLCGKALQQDRQVMNMMMTLLAKILKMSWLDLPDMQVSISELNKVFDLSNEHCLVALLTSDQIITEMTYVFNGKALSINRRVSVSFRENAMSGIFERCLTLIQKFLDQIQQDLQCGVKHNEILIQSLITSLEIIVKALNFDYSAIILNETSVDQHCTNLPPSWRRFIRDFPIIDNLFHLLSLKINSTHEERIKQLICQCIADFANLRHVIFENFEERGKYVQSPGVYKEFVRIVSNIETNFTAKDILYQNKDTVLLDRYCDCLYTFTIKSYQTTKLAIRKLSGVLNHIWQRMRNYCSINDIKTLAIVDNYVMILIQTYFDENLKILENDSLQNEDLDGALDEHFQGNEEAQDKLNLEHVSRMLKVKMELSMSKILHYFFSSLLKYELSIKQGDRNMRKVIERQLTFLISHTIQLFTFGMHSANSRISWYSPPCVQPIDDESIDEGKCKDQYADFAIIAKITYIMKLSNQVINDNNKAKIMPELQINLLKFMNLFKIQVICESRMLSIANLLVQQSSNDDDMDKDNNTGDSSNVKIYNQIAIMSGSTDMVSLMDVFIEKILQILIYTDGSQDLGRVAIQEALNAFETLISTPQTLKFCSRSQLVQAFVKQHVLSFNIFQHDNDSKHLVKFFKILSILWTSPAFLDDFNHYLDQLHSFIQQITSNEQDQVIKSPTVKAQIIKFYNIITGTARGLTNVHDYDLFFDWFNPNYFQITSEIMKMLISDDDICLAIMKFQKELILNRCQRLRLDSWNINGLISFRECSIIIISYMQFYDNFKAKPVKRDAFKEKLKFISTIIDFYSNAISGGYLCFGSSQYYQDSTFQLLSTHLFTSISSLNWDEIKKPKKKSPMLNNQILAFYQGHQNTFQMLMNQLVYTLVFEDHTNLANYSRCFHSLFLMCENNASKVIFDAILQEERNEARQQKICEEMVKMITNIPNSLETRCRNMFNPKFIVFKNYLLSDK